MSVYAGVPWQRGYGLGAVFGGLGKVAVPILKSAGRLFGKQLLKTGVGLASDVLRGRNLKQAAKARLTQAALTSIKGAINKPVRKPKRSRKRKVVAGKGRPTKRARKTQPKRDVFD